MAARRDHADAGVASARGRPQGGGEHDACTALGPGAEGYPGAVEPSIPLKFKDFQDVNWALRSGPEGDYLALIHLIPPPRLGLPHTQIQTTRERYARTILVVSVTPLIPGTRARARACLLDPDE